MISSAHGVIDGGLATELARQGHDLGDHHVAARRNGLDMTATTHRCTGKTRVSDSSG